MRVSPQSARKLNSKPTIWDLLCRLCAKLGKKGHSGSLIASASPYQPRAKDLKGIMLMSTLELGFSYVYIHV